MQFVLKTFATLWATFLEERSWEIGVTKIIIQNLHFQRRLRLLAKTALRWQEWIFDELALPVAASLRWIAKQKEKPRKLILQNLSKSNYFKHPIFKFTPYLVTTNNTNFPFFNTVIICITCSHLIINLSSMHWLRTWHIKDTQQQSKKKQPIHLHTKWLGNLVLCLDLFFLIWFVGCIASLKDGDLRAGSFINVRNSGLT